MYIHSVYIVYDASSRAEDEFLPGCLADSSWRWRLSIACHWMLRCAMLRVWLCHSRQLNVYICSGHCVFSGCPFLWSPCPTAFPHPFHSQEKRLQLHTTDGGCSCCHGALEQIVLVTIGGWTCLLPCLDRWTECHCDCCSADTLYGQAGGP